MLKLSGVCADTQLPSVLQQEEEEEEEDEIWVQDKL